MKYWNNSKIKAFRSTDNVVFIKGPFTINKRIYDWQFIDYDGIDYATSQQLEWWDIEMKHVIDNMDYINNLLNKGHM